MSSATLKKLFHVKDQLVEMVLDIENILNLFLGALKVRFDKNESSDLITFNGDLKVGKSI